jgi:hypothetical protein
MTLLRELDPDCRTFCLAKRRYAFITRTNLSRSIDEQKQKSGCLPSDMAINSPAEKKQFAF